jgi:hypothetical protein
MKTNVDEKTGPTEVPMNNGLRYVALVVFVIFLIPGAFSAPVANFTGSPAPGARHREISPLQSSSPVQQQEIPRVPFF